MVQFTRRRLLAPKLTFQKIELFCRFVALGSVTKAAEELGIAQPAVTAHLRDLEDKVGVRLVQRHGRNLKLTEAGIRFHHWSQEMLTRSLEMSRELGGLADGTSGSAIIAASMNVGTYTLPNLLAIFQRDYPTTHLTSKIGNTQVTTEAVRTGECDFGVLLLDPSQNIERLEITPLWNEKLVLVAAIDDDRLGDQVTKEEIAILPFITTPSSLFRRNQEDEILWAAGVPSRNIVLELGHPEAIKRAIRQRAGVSFIEKTAILDEVERGELRVIDTPDVELEMILHLAHRRDKSLSEMQLRLMRYIEAARPAGLSVL